MVIDARRGPEEQLQLPPGFRFYPSDEELVVHYLSKKAACQPLAVPIIGEVNLYKFDPWDLPDMALFGEKEWYFFSPRDRKYPNGSRPNRAAGSGHWKATGTDKPIMTFGGSQKVGVKKALVFYKGKSPRGVKTNWIMHEYRLADSGSIPAKRAGSKRLDDWVLCRVYKKITTAQKAATKESGESSGLDDVVTSIPEIEDAKFMSSVKGFPVQHDVKPRPSLLYPEKNRQAYENARNSEGLKYPGYSQSMLNSSLGLGCYQQLGMMPVAGADTANKALAHLSSEGQADFQSSHGAGRTLYHLSMGQLSGPRDSSVHSASGLEHEETVKSTSLYSPSSSGQPNRDAFSGSDPLTFIFDGLPSLFGCSDSISSSEDGGFFMNWAGDCIQ